ncbi:hypothetical protein ABXS71_19630 [Bacillus infantis]|uniref:hypothetical protein n=1 Tax=Bacillus infantis TaxID=324767 RepID=UPI003450CD71
MNCDQQEHKRFLEEQLEWCRKEDRILETIEVKLHKMKELAEFACFYELTAIETDMLNGQLDELRKEVQYLEQQLYSVSH